MPIGAVAPRAPPFFRSCALVLRRWCRPRHSHRSLARGLRENASQGSVEGKKLHNPHENGNFLLEETETKSVLRVVSDDPYLTHALWTFFHQEETKDPKEHGKWKRDDHPRFQSFSGRMRTMAATLWSVLLSPAVILKAKLFPRPWPTFAKPLTFASKIWKASNGRVNPRPPLLAALAGRFRRLCLPVFRIPGHRNSAGPARIPRWS